MIDALIVLGGGTVIAGAIVLAAFYAYDRTVCWYYGWQMAPWFWEKWFRATRR